MIEQQQQEARTWGMLAHLSALSGLLTGGLGTVLGPLIVWLIKKDQMPFVDDQGKESLNFHLTMFIGYLISYALMCVGIGFITIFIVLIVDVVFTILASVEANKGVAYRYPFNVRLIK
jgi:uncharacterized protein